MTDDTSFDTATRIIAGDDGTTYDGVAIALHWATAFLVIANFALAQTWDWFAKPTQHLMEDTHMSFGVLLTAVIVARIAWRLNPGAPSLVARSRLAADRVESDPLFALHIARGRGGARPRVPLGRRSPNGSLVGIPPLIGEIAKPLRHQLREFHEWIGWAIIIIAALHAASALYHYYVLKDRVLKRMLPGAA